jgi:sulfatase maturation enzyme AslB (radical SAM superfamily)
MNSHFCVNPWISAHIKLDQGYNPCCLFNKTYRADSLTAYAQSPELTSLKNRMLSDEQVEECGYCWMQEQQGYDSKRIRDNKTYQKIFLHRFKDRELELQSNFNEYYIRLGNHCNLRCTTCTEEFSTGWVSENKKFGLLPGPTVLIDDHDPLWQHLKDNAKDIAVLQFIGGEPFMMSVEPQRDLLKFLAESGHAKHIRIKYNTNLTRLPTEQLPYWPAFKAIEINGSMDGVGDRFEYLRFPAKWNDADSHIDFYKNLIETTTSKLELTVMHTVSLYNIGYVQEMLDYGSAKGIPVFLNLLEFPNYYNVFNATPKVKQWIKDMIKSIDNSVIKNIHDQLDQYPGTTDNIQLLKLINTLDQRRGLHAAKTFPELIEVITSDRPY